MSFRRSLRNASKLAAIKISQIATTEYSSDSDSSANSPIPVVKYLKKHKWLAQ